MAKQAETAATEWRIEIADGPNVGARVALTAGRHRLGCDPGNDIVLADPAIASEQAAMEIGTDGATFMALAPGAAMQRRRLQVGRRHILQTGAEIRLGRTLLRVVGPSAPHRQASPWTAGAAALLAGVSGAFVAYWLSAPVMSANGHDPAIPSEPRGAVTAGGAATALQNHLVSAKLDGAVRVTAADGALAASGAVLPADRPAWLDTQKWFDGRFAGHIALIDHVGVAKDEDLPRLDLAAVSMMPVPNVVTRGGEHYTEGAVLQGGWLIASITPAGVTLRLGTRTMRITL
jgi:hypothetical protein